MPEENAYFVRGEDGEEYGPVALAELRTWVGENRVGLGTTVRLDEPGELWQPWQYHAELVALLAQARVTGPMADGSLPVIAPIGRRIVAGLLDLVLSHLLLMPIIFTSILLLPADLAIHLMLQGVLPQSGPAQMPFWFELTIDLIYFGGLTLYYTCFHALHGRTPAKSVTRLRVVDQNGRKPSPLKAFLRALVFIVCISPPLWGLPLLYIYLNPQRRALHDMVAGTYVVER
jgi:uncharacterized RDD family membrane protein YckC